MHDDVLITVDCPHCGLIVQSVHDLECAYGGWHDDDMIEDDDVA